MRWANYNDFMAPKERQKVEIRWEKNYKTCHVICEYFNNTFHSLESDEIFCPQRMKEFMWRPVNEAVLVGSQGYPGSKAMFDAMKEQREGRRKE